MCELIGAEYKRGNGKTCQLERFGEGGFQRFFNFEKVGRGKYEVLEIYDEPLPVEDERHKGNARGIIKFKVGTECFDIDDETIAHGPGVYKIENDEYIYIGSTTRYLTSRFLEHYYNRNGRQNETQEVLKNGGKFTCLQSFENGTPEKVIRKYEADYIRRYKNTDKILLNNRMTAKKKVRYAKKKVKYKTIKILEENFDEIIDILLKEGYSIIGDKVILNDWKE